MGKKFNHLNVPSHWKHYWTKYPEGYTILEALLNWVAQVDKMVDNINDWNDYLNDFVITFDKDLQGKVISTLREWQDSGFLDVVIDEALQTQMDTLEQETHEKLSQFNSRLNQTEQDLLEKSLNVKAFGAVGDGVTDDTQAIKQAVEYAQTLDFKPTILFPNSNGGYYTTDTITIPPGYNVLMESPIIYGGIHDRPALKVGNHNAHNFNVELKLQVTSKTQSDWSNENYVGVQVINAYSCLIKLFNIRDFTVGAELLADNGLGFTMNNVVLNYFRNNKYNLVVSQQNNGWPNANKYYGGLFYRNTNVNSSQRSYGVAIISKDGSYTNINANVFYGPHFEGTKENIPILIDGANYNAFYDIRAERNSDIALAIVKNGSWNIINSNFIVNGSTRVETHGSNFANRLSNEQFLIYNSGKLGKKLRELGNGNVEISGELEFINFNGSINRTSDGFEKTDTAITFKTATEGVSFLLDTSIAKQFTMTFVGDPQIRLSLIPYNASGEKLVEQISVVPGDGWEFNRTVRRGYSYVDIFGGVLRNGLVLSDLATFEVHPDVQKVRVIISMQSSMTKLESFTVLAYDSPSSSVYAQTDHIAT